MIFLTKKVDRVKKEIELRIDESAKRSAKVMRKLEKRLEWLKVAEIQTKNHLQVEKKSEQASKTSGNNHRTSSSIVKFE